LTPAQRLLDDGEAMSTTDPDLPTTEPAAYLSAIGSLLEGDDLRGQAAQVGEQMQAITSDCQAALGGI
jgi:hypothetical protein